VGRLRKLAADLRRTFASREERAVERPYVYKCRDCMCETASTEPITACGYCGTQRPTVREAARRRYPLDGADAQALEGALQQAERDVAKLRDEVERLRKHCAWRMEYIDIPQARCEWLEEDRDIDACEQSCMKCFKCVCSPEYCPAVKEGGA
jgi:hypothetical protein